VIRVTTSYDPAPELLVAPFRQNQAKELGPADSSL